MDSYQQLLETIKEAKQLCDDLAEQGIEYAKAEAAYQACKYRRAMEMKSTLKLAVTLIQIIIKGDKEVNPLLYARDVARSNYETTKEALYLRKREIGVLEAQVDREYRG